MPGDHDVGAKIELTLDPVRPVLEVGPLSHFPWVLSFNFSKPYIIFYLLSIIDNVFFGF